jgi:hypothetical protein
MDARLERSRFTNADPLSNAAFCCNGFQQLAASERSEHGRYLEAVANSNARLGLIYARMSEYGMVG